MDQQSVRVGVDIGGTFTDVAVSRGGALSTCKVLTNYAAPEQAILDAIELADGTALKSKGRQFIKNGQRLCLSLPGGGGYGLPALRDHIAVQKDLESGFITENQAKSDYQYIKEP